MGPEGGLQGFHRRRTVGKYAATGKIVRYPQVMGIDVRLDYFLKVSYPL